VGKAFDGFRDEVSGWQCGLGLKFRGQFGEGGRKNCWKEKMRKYVKWQLEKDKHMEQLKLWK